MCDKKANLLSSTVELADIFRQHADAYLKTHQLSVEQHQVVNAILNCRTSVLGGHVLQCDHCQGKHYQYHSCRNRHCPKCESFKAAQWLEARQAELLPVGYFHVVFTLPHELNNLVLYNKRELYNVLFQSVWETLKTLGADKWRLGGEMGMLAVLHTWGQNLSQHNHLHCIVPGGAIKHSGKWVSSKKYLFPVKVLSKLFRGKYVAKLREAYRNKSLTLPSKLTETLSANQFDTLLNTLMKKDWIVYAKEPFAGPENLLRYLGRYTHKIAIANHRIISCNKDTVTFSWRDYADNNQQKIMHLNPQEFIRRYLSHVLPKGFMRIRSFGFLANPCKAKKVLLIQKQLNHQPTKAQKRDIATLMLVLTGKDITRCPTCQKGKLLHIADIVPLAKFGRTKWDTS